MVRSKQIKLNPRLVKHILTLRYSPEIRSEIPKLTWKNFVEKKQNTSSDYVEKIIIAYIKNKINDSTKDKVALALSGGIDSTLVLSFLMKSVPTVKIKTISVKFSNSYDETKQSSRIASKFGIDHETIFIENYLENLPDAIGIVKLPIWDLHWYNIAKKSHSIAKFIVSGDGGDELFGGYTFRYNKFLSLITKNSSTKKKIESYLECHQRDWVDDQEQIFSKKIKFSWSEIHNILKPFFNNSLHPLQQVLLADFNGKLRHNFSIVNTKLNDNFRLKAVTPLLSKHMIEYATHIPMNLKYDKDDNLGKLLLRNILTKHGLAKFTSKSKRGFSIDTVNLWKSYGRQICDYYLSDARTVKDGLINKEWINKNMKNEIDVRKANKFLGLLAFEIWYRIFITKEMDPKEKLSK